MSEKKIIGKFYGTSKEEEAKMLSHIRQVAEEKIFETRQSVTNLQEELHELQEVYDLDEKEGLAQWFNTDARFQEVRRDLLRAERARKKPYFGRIDILDEENGRRDTFYIGKTVIGANPAKPEVIDWRAPISSVYYDHSLGICHYKVPSEGIFEVDLQRKRTYEIEEDQVKDFYDSDVVANDDLLTKYLSKSKRNVLSEIIATIQQEQNEVIRKNPRHNVLVQGSAGSGKTTVAMHRISYILYNYDLEFKPESFYIVGSNKVLLNYITGVLPDLDVYGVSQMTMEDLFVRLLYEDWDDRKLNIRHFEKTEKSIGIKGTTKWFQELKEFCDEVEWNHIPRTDIKIEKNDRVIMTAKEIEEAIREYPDWAMYQKFVRMNDILMGKLENELYGRYYSYNVEEQKKITQHFKNYFFKFIWKDSVFDLYKVFVDGKRKDNPDLIYIEGKPDLYDLASLAFIYKRIKESEVIQEASHVVIDEAQDFGMMVYNSLKYCMSKCTFTIMGDVSQNINFDAGLSDWEELKKVMLPDKYDYFGLLRKSYRNTVEISKFATDILRHGSFPIYPVEPIIRHGDEVNPVLCINKDELNSKVLAKIINMQQKGYETIAIICKDVAEAEEVYEELRWDINVKLFSDKDTEFGNGTIVVPIEYSKGLEFDAVIIYNASESAYPKEDGYAKLLYVAATRALHELAVFYRGKLTGLVADPIPKDRLDITFAEDDFHIKPYVYEEEFKTKAQIAMEQAAEGDRERALRDKFGPKKIEVNKPESFNEDRSKKPLALKQQVQNDANTPKRLNGRIVKEIPADSKSFRGLGGAAYSGAGTFGTVKGVGNNIFSNQSVGAGTKKVDAGNTPGAGYLARTSGNTEGAKPLPRAVARPSETAKRIMDAQNTPVNRAVTLKKPVDRYHMELAYEKPVTIEEKGGSEYGTMPAKNLSPAGHGKIDNSVKWIGKDKKRLDVTGAYGTLRIIPVSGDTVRILFAKGEFDKIKALPEEIKSKDNVSFTVRDSREAVEMTLEKLVVQIDKKSGALSFVSKAGGVLLKENPELPRQFHGAEDIWWEYFDWGKKENLGIRGETDGDWKELNQTARYISHGEGSDRPSLIMSSKGYQLLVPGGIKTLICTIPAYGPYLCFENTGCIDYIFRAAK